jgi:hypothetical protein
MCTVTKRVGLAVSGAMAVVALASCGGGDGGTAASTPASGSGAPPIVPRAQFVKQAKAICDRFNEQRNDEISAFYERRADETGEGLGAVGAVEAIPEVVVPTLRQELAKLEAIGLPEGEAYEAEAGWQTLRTVLHEVEAEGIYAWRSAKLLPPFRNRVRQFGLDSCVIN